MNTPRSQALRKKNMDGEHRTFKKTPEMKSQRRNIMNNMRKS